MKRYLLYTLKKYIPFYIISFAICLSFLITAISSSAVSLEYYTDYEGHFLYSSSSPTMLTGLIVSAVLMFLFTSILPIIANKYRYSLQSADLFNQIGTGRKNIRYVNNIVLLSAFIISFTLSYVIAIAILGIKEIPNLINGETVTEINRFGETVYRHSIPFYYNFWYFIPTYFLYLILGIANYFISYFLVTRANNALNSIIMLVVGQVILLLIFISPLYYIGFYGAIFKNEDILISTNTDFIVGSKAASFIGPIAIVINLFANLFLNRESDLINRFKYWNNSYTTPLVLTILALLLFVFATCIAIIYFLKEDESSGELAGKPDGRDKFQYILFNVGVAVIGAWYLVLSSLLVNITSLSMIEAVSSIALFTYIPAVITFGALYYVFHSLLKRNFRIKPKDLRVMLPIFFGVFILSLVPIICSISLAG